MATRFASTSTEAQKKAEDGEDAVGEGLKKAGKALQVRCAIHYTSFTLPLSRRRMWREPEI